jgi:hypothetical protein
MVPVLSNTTVVTNPAVVSLLGSTLTIPLSLLIRLEASCTLNMSSV